MSLINFLCSHCGAPLRVPRAKAGLRRKCPRCSQYIEAPAESNPSSSSTGSGYDSPGSQPSSLRESRDTFETALSAGDELDCLEPAQAPDELGRLGSYRILSQLGSGGMGVVFLAEDVKLRRRVALKLMKLSQAANKVNRQRFIREARAIAGISNDHIVPIYDVNEDHEPPYLVMQLLLGESLEARLNRTGKQPTDEVIRVGMEIAEGLAAAHEQALIHRDIKPANIWLEEGRDRVKIVDFGLVFDDSDGKDHKLTQDNILVGTPMYMSPEQASGDIPLDHRSDLFSLGSVLYRMCTGKLPFKGKTTLNVLAALATKKPKPPREVNPAVPRALSGLILQLLQKRPEDRPKSANAVIAALTDIKNAPPEEEEVLAEEVVEEEEEEAVEVEPDPEPVMGRVQRTRVPRGGGKRGGRRERESRSEEDELARKVIKFAIFAGVCVGLLLAFLVIKNTFFTGQ